MIHWTSFGQVRGFRPRKEGNVGANLDGERRRGEAAAKREAGQQVRPGEAGAVA